MFNHILENLLGKNNLLFENEQVTGSDGALMVRVLVLWNIDEHHDKREIIGLLSVVKCPAFQSVSHLVEALMIVERKVRLERMTLENLTANLFQVLNLHAYWNEQWCKLHSELEFLASTLRYYADNLIGERECMPATAPVSNKASTPTL